MISTNKYFLFVLLPFILLPISVASQSEPISNEFDVLNSKDEVSIGVGNLNIFGDVRSKVLDGYSIHVMYRKDISHILSLRPSLFWGQTKGTDPFPLSSALLNEEHIFDGYGTDNPWFPAYNTNMLSLSLDGLIELSNLSPTSSIWNYYFKMGAGLYSAGTKLNLLNNQGQPYNDLLELTSYNDEFDPNTSKGRSNILDQIYQIYDDSYETPGPKEYGKFRLGDETNIHPFVNFGAGVAIKLNKHINIACEYELILSSNDYLDGIAWRTNMDRSKYTDLIHMGKLLINIPIPIKSQNKQEPMHWQNPWISTHKKLDSISSELSKLKAKLKDTDNDGVLDFLDREKYSKKDCPVNTIGVTLDSDNDGMYDCDDPFPYFNNNDFAALVDKINDKMEATGDKITSNIEVVNDQFPIIYFEPDSHTPSDIELFKLPTIVKILKQNDVSKCLKIIGHTDSEMNDDYNKSLALKRAQAIKSLLIEMGIDSSRLTVESKGEDNPLVNESIDSFKRYNRRVEFEACKNSN